MKCACGRGDLFSPSFFGDLSEINTFLYLFFVVVVNVDCHIMNPKLLEVNFSPDTLRACKYHPDFYNHVFECLFLPESLHSNDLPVTKLQ